MSAERQEAVVEEQRCVDDRLHRCIQSGARLHDGRTGGLHIRRGACTLSDPLVRARASARVRVRVCVCFAHFSSATFYVIHISACRRDVKDSSCIFSCMRRTGSAPLLVHWPRCAFLVPTPLVCYCPPASPSPSTSPSPSLPARLCLHLGRLCVSPLVP